jgi:hypothetical protein
MKLAPLCFTHMQAAEQVAVSGKKREKRWALGDHSKRLLHGQCTGESETGEECSNDWR